MTAQSDMVTLVLPREEMQRIWELVVARAVTLEAGEDLAMQGLGSRDWRDPADAIRSVLDA